jgi:hypothetical protein
MLKPRVSNERLEDSLRRLKPLDATSNVMLPKVWLTCIEVRLGEM